MSLPALFRRDILRTIPPVVYFHEDTRDRLAAEVDEYIVTGGHPEGSDAHTRVPHGIHEAYVRLMRAMHRAITGQDDHRLPASWISGFYGSGKSSFAKLLGYALDGRTLPDGRTLGDALVARDTSPHAPDLAQAWHDLHTAAPGVAAVFDIGGFAREGEPIHSAVVRAVQKRLGYCTGNATVAHFELALERGGEWQAFEAAATATFGHPWSAHPHLHIPGLAAHAFSEVMHRLKPATYVEPLTWFTAEGGGNPRAMSSQEAARAIHDMLAHRAPGRHLFVVVDEVVVLDPPHAARDTAMSPRPPTRAACCA